MGSRLDSRQTGSPELFKGDKHICHIDIESGELNNNIKGCVVIHDDLTNYLYKDLQFPEVPEEWIEEIETEKEKYPDVNELKNINGINPNEFIHRLSRESHEAEAFIADVGSNQMWTAQSIELNKDQLFLTSGGMGAMGYSLPAAIGASFLLGDVVCITGDGGLQINIQELQTISRNNLPVKIVVLNNHCLGMIRQFQDLYFDSRYQSTILDYSAPDFTKVAIAYGIEASSISRPEEIEFGLQKLWEYQGAYLLDVHIDPYTNVSPRVKFGNPITKMN
jgi:acetolactate synthase-1/2/3 large subunit